MARLLRLNLLRRGYVRILTLRIDLLRFGPQSAGFFEIDRTQQAPLVHYRQELQGIPIAEIGRLLKILRGDFVIGARLRCR